MKKIIITQRYEKIGQFKELRDNLDVRLINLIFKLGFLPIIVPSNPKNILKYAEEFSPTGIILSGGGDPRKKDERYYSEKKLINFGKTKRIPILGICRGAQRINIHFNGKLTKVKNHVRKIHLISGLTITGKIRVNSYHDLGFNKKIMGKNLKVLATSDDGIVKYFKHKNNKIFGIMWHPEREIKVSNFDKKLIESIFK
tara:strand:+ start:35 stop:631 length:597 start_codon:yes stop_codon:yes gene_type:complete